MNCASRSVIKLRVGTPDDHSLRAAMMTPDEFARLAADYSRAAEKASHSHSRYELQMPADIKH
jgi:hypothetical protein